MSLKPPLGTVYSMSRHDSYSIVIIDSHHCTLLNALTSQLSTVETDYEFLCSFETMKHHSVHNNLTLRRMRRYSDIVI